MVSTFLMFFAHINIMSNQQFFDLKVWKPISVRFKMIELHCDKVTIARKSQVGNKQLH